MLVFLQSEKPLATTAIVTILRELRQNAVTPYSNYQVSTLIEIKQDENLYFYTAGVNIESDEHNRLSLHAEQTALANALTLLGGNTTFSKAWVMAAPKNAIPDENQIASKSCGHCRQIMMSLADRDAEIYAVTLDGRLTQPDRFDKNFLLDCFSERDLNMTSMNLNSSLAATANSTLSRNQKRQAWELLNEKHNLSTNEIVQYLRVLSPHIISPSFQTSPFTACIVKCHNSRYAAGVLVQDIAFLSIDAIFSAIANAIIQFGENNLRFDEIHLASTSLDPGQFTSTEIEALSRRYVHEKTTVHFYTPTNTTASYSFIECKQARDQILNKFLKNNSRS